MELRRNVNRKIAKYAGESLNKFNLARIKLSAKILLPVVKNGSNTFIFLSLGLERDGYNDAHWHSCRSWWV